MPTELQQQVWDALRLIPKGRVTTYGAIAEHIGTNAVRAVASAVGKNRDVPDTPCHRVLPATGMLGKYSGAGGADSKKKLLIQEGIGFIDDKVVNFKDVVYYFM